MGDIPDSFLAEISGQPQALRRAAAGIADQTSLLADAVAHRSASGAMILAGMGSSYDACYPAATFLAHHGIVATMVDAAELLHERLPMLDADDTLVLVSQSGESAETVRVAACLRDRGNAPYLVAVTNGIENPLAGLADVTLDTRVGRESGPSTMTFEGSLVVMSGLARVVAGMDPAHAVAALEADTDLAAVAIDSLLADEGLPDALVDWHGGRPTMVVLGRGAARAAAEMGALTLKEAVGMPAEALQTAQFRHGPLELAGASLAAFVLATEPSTRELDLTLADELRSLGTAVWTITDEGPADGHTTVIGTIDPLVRPAVGIVPMQLLAWRLATLSGREPGSFQRASKVTTHE